MSSSAKADDPVNTGAGDYWVARSSRAMTAVNGWQPKFQADNAISGIASPATVA
jgi:hypothetical protein